MTDPSKSFTTESLWLAREMLADARLMLERESYRSAVDRAYYAMFHAVRAALHKDGVDLPKTHAGLRSQKQYPVPRNSAAQFRQLIRGICGIGGLILI